MDMDLKLYKVTNNDFVELTSVEPTDLVIVEHIDEKTIYVYKNPSQSVYDEFESQHFLPDVDLQTYSSPHFLSMKKLSFHLHPNLLSRL